MDRVAKFNKRLNKIITDRENECIKYNDKKVLSMINRRLKKITTRKGKEVWLENNVFFIEDAEDPDGFIRYIPFHCGKEKEYYEMKEIKQLQIVLDSF